MYEVEFKLRVDHNEIRSQLNSMDVEALDTVVQEDTYFDAPYRDFTSTGESLRVRREHSGEETTSRLTYKGPLVDDQSKTREELETRLGEHETAHGILESLGFVPVATVEKERERFRVDRYLITLDAVSSLGEFLEIETEAFEDEIPSVREDARTFLEELGLEPKTGMRTSYLEMILADEEKSA